MWLNLENVYRNNDLINICLIIVHEVYYILYSRCVGQDIHVCVLLNKSQVYKGIHTLEASLSIWSVNYSSTSYPL